MHMSGRDSGYSENATTDFAPSARTSSSFPLFAASPTTGSSKDCCRSSSDDYKLSDSRITGSSCRALKHAVSNLTRLDDFILEKIGDGFFSEVFKVTHRVTGEVMVLKMNLLRSNRANMLKEVQLMNRLSHPNILKFMGVCVHEGQLHALTEYINGGSLEQLIQSNQELRYSLRMKLALDIAKGMEYLHSKDVFHRDLTSKNVLIKKSEDAPDRMMAVVGDFGLASKIPRPDQRLPTVGSPWWMSPECLKGQQYDEKSDTFSYGIILCEMIARIDADPDRLPRTSNFGLDYFAFVEICSQLPIPPPPDFLKLAFSCCNLEPRSRPSFRDVVKILEKAASSVASNQFLLKSHSLLTEARSVENLPTPRPSHSSVGPSSHNSHRKLAHRRSLSDDIGLITFPSPTAPSDKARCHTMPSQLPPLKRVGESMCREDPHYKPSLLKSNPFASLSQFKGVKKILASTNSTDLFSSCFELPSPFYDEEKSSPGKKHARNLARIEKNSKLMDLKSSFKLLDRKSHSEKKSSAAELCDVFKSKTSATNSSIIIEPVVKPSEIKKSVQKSIPAKAEKLQTFKEKSQSQDDKSSVTSLNKSTLNVGTPRVVAKRKPLSLPSSPTFSRRCNLVPKQENAQKIVSDESPEESLTPKFATLSCLTPCSSASHPLYCSRGYPYDVYISTGRTLRACSSSSNLNALDNNAYLPCEVPILNLKRRGSCESGFYSSIGDDFCIAGTDIYAGHHHNHTASSFTLSSSSAASSLFLDSAGDDIPTPLLFNSRYPPIGVHHTASSTYTDSSEDISSLASSDPPLWDDRHRPQHISKIVEYFEKKQVGSSNSSRPESVTRIASLHHPGFRRNWLQTDGQTRSSLDYYTRRKLFEKPLSAASQFPKRSVNQRLIICEGAVKSKLQLFDKKT